MAETKQKSIGEAKVYEPDWFQENELPYSVLWEEIVDAPQSVADLNPTDGAALAAATTAIDGLGDLAYEDLVDELHLAADAVASINIKADAITNTKIADNAVDTPQLNANAVSADKIQSNAITAVKIQAGAIVAGKIAAGAIDGITITGSLIRTSSSGTRVELNQSNNDIRIYSGSTLRAKGYDQGWIYYDSGGDEVAEIYATSKSYHDGSSFSRDSLLLAADPAGSLGSIYLGAGVSGAMGFNFGTTGSTQRMLLMEDLGLIGDIDDYAGFNLYIAGTLEILYDNGFQLPTVGRVSSLGTLSGGGVGWDANRDSTGVYTVDHGLGTTSYSVVCTIEESSGIYDIKVSNRGSNSFTVRINDETDALTNAAFTFIIILWP